MRAALALALALATGAAWAGQAASQFSVQVVQSRALDPSFDEPDLCRGSTGNGAFGTTAAVVCNTGVVVELLPVVPSEAWRPVHGASHRYLPPANLGGLMGADMDFSTGMGTVTSWRVIEEDDRDVLEMTVHW